MVSAVRTERALERATSKQERIEDGLSGEKARKSVTVCSFASLCAEKKPAAQPAVATADSHSLVGRAIGGRHGGEALRRFEDAREVFGALHVAREPVHVVGGAGEHV